MNKFLAIIKSILLGIFVIIFPVFSGVLISIKNIEAPNTYYIQAISMLIPTLIVIILLLFKKLNKNDLFLFFKLNKEKLLYILLTFTIFIPVAINGFHSVNAKTFFGLLLLYLFVGISEELYFRALVYKYLNEEFNTLWCIIISTLIFALGHASLAFSGASLSMTILTIFNALLFGLMAICLLLLTQSIYPIIFIHFIFDFETKFINLADNSLFIAELVRGALMTLISIFFLIKIFKCKNGIKNHTF